MKIIYLYDSIARTGGVERIFVDKMNYLAKKLQNEVYLITSSQGNHPLSFPLSEKVKHIDLNIRFHEQYQHPYPMRILLHIKINNQFKKRLQEEVDRINPDFIICTAAWMPDVVCKLKGKVKKIIESHSAKYYTQIPDKFTMGFFRDRLNEYTSHKRFKIIEKHCNAVVTLTHDDAKAWSKAPKVYVIPNITESILSESSKCEVHRVIAVGRLTYQKGFDRLIDAWCIVHKNHPDWTLDIYGEGVRRDALQKQIEENHLKTTVTIHQFTKNINKEYLNSSIFALSSNYEGFGLVLIEAMGCGLPCISFNCPYGPSEIIKNNEDGLIIENGDIVGFANAICYLIENEKERKTFGKRARQNVVRFSSENIMPKWEKLFKEMMEI